MKPSLLRKWEQQTKYTAGKPVKPLNSQLADLDCPPTHSSSPSFRGKQLKAKTAFIKEFILKRI